MRVTATDRAASIVVRARGLRTGRLTIMIGTGCCDSTDPYLYEDFRPGPDQVAVGDVCGVVVFAPEHLRRMYPGDTTMVIDVVDELAESLSIETEFGCRLVLRSEVRGRGAPSANALAAT